MEDFHISPLRHCEIGNYLAMLNQFRMDEGLPRTSITALRLEQAVFTNKRKLAIHVARKDSCTIGFISFKNFYEPGSGLTGFHLCDFFVEKQYRKCGVGKNLFLSCRRVACLTEKSFIWWVSQKDNLIALKFFNAMDAKYSMICSFVLNISPPAT